MRCPFSRNPASASSSDADCAKRRAPAAAADRPIRSPALPSPGGLRVHAFTHCLLTLGRLTEEKGRFAAPEVYRATLTAAEGSWMCSQTRRHDRQSHQVEVKWGRLRVVTIAFALPDGVTPKSWAMVVGDQSLDAELGQQGQQVMVRLREPITLNAGDTLQLELDL